MSEDKLELVTLDTRIARAHGAIERALQGLAKRDESERLLSDEERSILSNNAKCFSADFAGIRDLAGQSTFKGVQDLAAGELHQLHKDALLRWVHELVQLRIGWDLVVDESDAVHAPDPQLPRHRAEAAGTVLTFDDALTSLVDAPHVVATDIALRRLDALAQPVAAVRRELRERRFEIANRLGLAHPWALASSGPVTALSDLARSILDATEPLAVDLHKKSGRDVLGGREPASTAAHAVHDAFAREAREGWPAHLGSRWLAEVFGALFSRHPRKLPLPRAIGAASFLRAASAWGSAIREGSTSRSLPFTLARDPYPTEARTLGAALAITMADRVFAKRKLGLAPRAVDVHARALGRALFFTLRMTAARFVLAVPATPDADRIEELGVRVFGSPLPSALASAWAYGGFAGASWVDAPARLLGSVRAHGLVRDLVQRYDEDWFDNPRAGAHLSSIGVGPVWRGDVPEAGDVIAIARAFEEAIG